MLFAALLFCSGWDARKTFKMEDFKKRNRTKRIREEIKMIIILVNVHIILIVVIDCI